MLIKKAALLITVVTIFYCAKSTNGPTIKVWHGLKQKIGHLGMPQEDFNLMGEVSGPDSVVSLKYRLNDKPEIELTIGRGEYGFRRLAMEGHFNADIPVNNLNIGQNKITLTALDSKGKSVSVTVYIEKTFGNYPLPVYIDWKKVSNPQNVGQYIDGEWILEENGLRTKHSGYDRIFLIGDQNWKDYEVTVPVTINQVDIPSLPRTFKNGLGLLLRFSGHIVGGYRQFPAAQPKWGYQPFGGIGWLRWKKGKQNEAPSQQFYTGYADETLDFEDYPVEPGGTYWMKMQCETLAELPQVPMIQEKAITLKDGTKIDIPEIPIEKEVITLYSFKIWDQDQPEPEGWSWQVAQVSRHALRSGALALLAFHVDATFGNILVTPIADN
jgi:hypothetical protein